MKIGYDGRETRNRDERLASQEERLREMLRKGYQRSPLVKKMMDERDLTPRDFVSLTDLEKLPVLSREKVVELEASEPPYGGFCDRRKRIDRIFTSPGPVYEPHLGQRDPLWVRAYFAAGIRRGDIVLNTFSYHLVAAGLTFHDALRRLGATVVPSGTASFVPSIVRLTFFFLAMVLGGSGGKEGKGKGKGRREKGKEWGQGAQQDG